MAVNKNCGEEWIFSQNKRIEETLVVNTGSDSEKPFGITQGSIQRENHFCIQELKDSCCGTGSRYLCWARAGFPMASVAPGQPSCTQAICPSRTYAGSHPSCLFPMGKFPLHDLVNCGGRERGLCLSTKGTLSLHHLTMASNQVTII